MQKPKKVVLEVSFLVTSYSYAQQWRSQFTVFIRESSFVTLRITVSLLIMSKSRNPSVIIIMRLKT